jgi:hypothetical protein
MSFKASQILHYIVADKNFVNCNIYPWRQQTNQLTGAFSTVQKHGGCQLLARPATSFVGFIW